MSESSDPQVPANDSTSESSSLSELKLQVAAAAAGSRTVASLLEAANEDRERIKAVQTAVESIRIEIQRDAALSGGHATEAAKHAESTLASAKQVNDLLPTLQSAVSQATTAVETARGLSDSASKNAGLIEGLRTQVEQTAQVAEKRSAHIEDGRLHADEVRAKIDGVLTVAQQAATGTEAQLTAAQASTQRINETYQTALADQATIKGIAGTVVTVLAAVEGHAATTKKLADVAETTETRLADYEAKLATLHAQSERQQKRIDELLAGATDAGLASAFDKRSKKFKNPEYVWQGAFVLSLLGLIGLAIWQAYSYQKLDQLPDWQQVARMLAMKLPFAAPLVWLAIHSARHAAFAKQMEEEYAFKATISMAFSGYRKQMAEVGKDLDPEAPLSTLCKNTLREITAPPGRV